MVPEYNSLYVFNAMHLFVMSHSILTNEGSDKTFVSQKDINFPNSKILNPIHGKEV